MLHEFHYLLKGTLCPIPSLALLAKWEDKGAAGKMYGHLHLIAAWSPVLS